MAYLGFTFDPNTVPADEDRELLPAGLYVAQVIESEVKATKSGSGQILKLTWEILQGPSSRRRVWQQINIVNANPTAQKIGQQELKRITDALGLGPITNSDALHFKPLTIQVAVKEAEGQYTAQNVIKDVRAANVGAVVTNDEPPFAAAPSSSAQGGARSPWAKK